MKKNSQIIALLLSFGLSFTKVSSQENILQQYIDSALKNNIALQQKNISIEKAMYSLKTAKALFQPTIAVQGSYQTGEGGRAISLPVGDLLNPVYSTLNKLTSSNKFPEINNVETNFFPSNFYDLKLNTLMPIYNKDIQFNKQIQAQQLEIQKTDAEAYKRELIKNIKTAYYNYHAALRAVKIYENAAVLASEGKKVNEKLLANGKGLPAYILRSESEISQLTAQVNDAQKQAESAKMYLNFLLNRDLEKTVDTTLNNAYELQQIKQSNVVYTTVSGREEIKLLSGLVDLNNTVLQMNKSYWYPKLNGYLNLGSQSDNWKFNKESSYYFGGLQLDIPIFNGKRNQYKIRQAELDKQSATNNLKQATQQMSLSAKMAQNNLNSSLINYTASQKQMEAASAYQRLIERGYREGVNTYIETLDARNQLINASLLININEFKVLIAAAELERETASYQIQSK
jgi:outer membrane protein TolC